MSNIILTTPEQLNEIVSRAIKDALSNFKFANNSESINEADELISCKQACFFLKISLPTLYKRIDDNTIPFQKVGRKYLFSKRQIMQSLGKRSNTKKYN